jgi:hypothetical protein
MPIKCFTGYSSLVPPEVLKRTSGQMTTTSTTASHKVTGKPRKFMGIQFGMKYTKSDRKETTFTYQHYSDSLKALGEISLTCGEALYIVGSRESILQALAESVTEPQICLRKDKPVFITVFHGKGKGNIIAGIKNTKAGHEAAHCLEARGQGLKVHYFPKGIGGKIKYTEDFVWQEIPKGENGILSGADRYSIHPGQLSGAVKNLLDGGISI